ncbi:DEAD/DEAH box helicase family protein [uncultured Phascolarctobacterium sp.]|uniref:DEAD/DEAH box helicase family protein n=1 Tax=uncultured Phascolarctobacterium sp. TaxID=512296 RepID=UPI00262F6CC0|nr:DEAD/DEAH box helicase family protein [uncultured Phascolarctobacterium sp.]
MAMQININPYANIVPKIYAYTTPEIASHDGWTKIGYTEQDSVRKRIEQQTKTADVRFNIEWQQEARYTDGSGEYFNDHSFHDYLERFAHIERKPTTEWFKIDGPKSQQLLWKFAARSYAHVQAKNKMTYILRKEQQQAVDATYVYYQKCLQSGEREKAEFLWNAKPRFGKTLTSYDFMRKMDARMVLIVTNRPAIANSWFDDFEKFIAWQTDYRFVSTTDSLKERATLTREQFLDAQIEAEDKNQELRMVAFLSLQDLKGSVYFGGTIDKLRWVAENNWDLLIIDEAHEGVDTHKTDKAFDKINRKFTLHLSGTPFKAVAMGKFAQEQIFNWTFSDEQEAKDNWQEETLNPYACMPRMNMYTYQMSQIAIDKVNRGIDLSDDDKTEFTFDLNEFFKTNERGQFIHKNEVKKFLDALVEQEKFPFSTPELRKELAHTFWLLERVDSAKALAKMLKEHPIFENYEIVLAAGDGRLEEEDASKSKRSFDKVREAIKNHDKTITLSVGQLTTGVTIPEWTAVFMLSNMKSPAEYIQAAFRAQNPFKFEKDGKLYQKENAYIFDFAPERTLMIFDEFANSLYSGTSGGGGTKSEREANIKRLLNFFAVFAEDQDGKMEQVDAAKVLTIPLKIKTEEVIRRGFMSNMLFSNIGVVFNAPKEVVEILNKMEPVKEQGSRKEKLDHEELQEVPVDENGNIEIPQETVVKQTNAIFGEKIYEEVPVKPLEPYKEVGDDTKPEEAMAVGLAQKIAETLHDGIYGEQAQSDYGLTKAESKRIEEKVQKQAEEALKRVAEEFADKKKILEADLQHELAKATTEAEKIQVQEEHAEKVQQATREFNETMEKRTQEVIVESAQKVVEEQETKKEEKKMRSFEGDIRDRLRGFARTIPSFIMAYGDDKLVLKNFETYPKEEVFKDVTSVTIDEFKMLRDGFEYIDEETGEKKKFPGGVFAEDVFDSSVQEFLNKKRELADYFAETSEEDIFDYIPPQKTNQIFTPKKVVQMMVDQLVETEPHIFESPDKTFVDFYMKSGLYITEIVKRLYRNKVLKSIIPDDKERVKHILECQVFGFAPTQIIYDITMSYIFGFDEEAKNISRRNFFCEDTLPYAERGELQKLVNEKLGDRVK